MTRAAVEQRIVEMLKGHLPRSLCHAIDEGLLAAGAQAYNDTRNHHTGHIANALGQSRHFHSNERFAAALTAAGIEHSPICGNDIITARVGPLLLARFSTKQSDWNNARRSKRRLEVAQSNHWVEALLQEDLFGNARLPAQLAVFFVSIYSGSVRVQPERPIAVNIAVMDTRLSARLFNQSLEAFIDRYSLPEAQKDIAQPKMKSANRKNREFKT